VLTDRFDDHRPQITIAQHDQSMLGKPATCKLQQPLPIARARQFTTQYPQGSADAIALPVLVSIASISLPGAESRGPFRDSTDDRSSNE
jgi:hypothetical protein